MAEHDQTIRLILPPRAPIAAAPSAPTSLPRTGAPEEQLHAGFWTRISLDKLRSQIAELQGKIWPMVSDLSHAVTEGMELDEVTIGLAISVEGDIGIASAGAEASIELAFKIRKTG